MPYFLVISPSNQSNKRVIIIRINANIEEYFKREVIPHVPDAWIDHSKTKIGYEINFTRYFYKFKPLRKLSEIRSDIVALENKTKQVIEEIIKD
mgnify:CR=1 FL=1